MKTIKTLDDNFTFTAFEFGDLKGRAREHALLEHYTFMSSINEEEDEAGKMVPATLDYDENYIIENIEVNGYLFDLSGELLPMTHYTGNHPLSGKHSIRIFDEERMCVVY